MTVTTKTVSSGYSTGTINENFQTLEDYINDNLLNRDGVHLGQPNQMNVPLDMNSYPIINAFTDVEDIRSLITVGEGDARYVNLTGDTMQGSLDMATHPVFVRIAVNGNEPSRKDELDTERASRISGDSSLSNRITQEVDTLETNYQTADANLQAQISGGQPLEASAFSPISWHDQVIENSVTIPDNKNAWSFGPTMSIAAGQSVTIGEGSFWTIANGEVQV